MFTCSTLSTIPHIRHGFFGRQGGVSEGVYDSLNCGYGSGDNLIRVARNRGVVCDILGGGIKLLTAFQIHSAKVITVTTPWEWKESPEADALVTDRPGIALGILTADCLPVLFADRKKNIIGAAHAGWKGALGGVLEATIQAMRKLGAKDITASIGPAIGPQSYEVGAEFYERFVKDSRKNKKFFTPSLTLENSTAQGAARSGGVWGKGPQRAEHNKYLFDLPAYAKARLAKAGIKQIGHVNHDTLVDETRFFSYRRATLAGEETYGRQVSVIVLEQK